MNKEEVQSTLEKAFPGSNVKIWDMTGSENNYQIIIKAEEFKELNRIQRHRMVMKVFDVQLKSGEIHALTIKAEF